MEELDPKTDGSSADAVAENIEALKQLFPEAFTEDGVDFDALRETLGEYVDDKPERYSFTWNGKSRSRRIAQTPSTGTLRPCPEESVNWETTENLFIEGDNLEVLKLLQKSHHRRVKMIYIDPPYNTGHEFIYPDKFEDNLDTYLRYSGQVDAGGLKVSPNPETSGRYHTNWLNMMYPRLRLARNLLRDNGVIFVSINDCEVANLRKLCDEVFGEENFFAQIPWQSRTSVQNDTDLCVQHEYLVGYARVRRVEHRRLKPSNESIWRELPSFAAYPMPVDASRYSNSDNDPRGSWKADPFDAPNIRLNLTYAIVNPTTGEEHWPPQGRCWRVEQAKYVELLRDGRIVFGSKGTARPQLKVFLDEKRDFGETPTSWFDGDTYGTVTNGTKELQDLFDGSSPFTFPKPTTLIARLLQICTRPGDIVLDFFAGSATTAHACLTLGCVDPPSRRFVMVQLPEPCIDDPAAAKASLATIADIGKERIRRAIAKLGEQGHTPDGGTDLGLKVFKLDSSNITAWDADPDDLEGALFDAVQSVKPDRSEQDVLYELLLKYGLDLAVRVERRDVAGAGAFVIGGGALVVCLSDDVSLELAEGIATIKAELSPEVMRVVFKDAGFPSDVVKANTVQILHQVGIDDVKSL